MGSLAASLPDVVNLGQGYPDWQPPEFVTKAAEQAIRLGYNQYTRTQGHPELVEILADRYSTHFQREVDAMSEIAITVGCSQALYLSLTALIEPGDEVLLLEPFFELYLGQVKMSEGVPVAVPLSLSRSNGVLDLNKLEAAITPKTRVLILNTPHNPTGKVFNREEMEGIADIVRRHPHLSVISDEVYKYIINTPEGDRGEKKTHVHFAALDGMWDRTVTCSSAGKTFSITGWQVGWLVGPRDFVARVHSLLPLVQFCAPSPMQHALSQVLQEADDPYKGHDSYYSWLREMYASKRTMLLSGMEEAGLKPTEGTGGFFVMADARRLLPLVPQSYLDAAEADERPVDFALCRWLGEKHNIITIPGSPFFGQPDDGELEPPCLIRLAFCKSDEVLERANEQFRQLGHELRDYENKLIVMEKGEERGEGKHLHEDHPHAEPALASSK
eukprot:jgi/Bigna1/48736/estExt_Genewise1.C_310070